jgi:hypothetical protein
MLAMDGKNNILGRSTVLLEAIIFCVDRLLKERGQQDETTSIFNLKAAPTISVSDYLGSKNA